MELNIIKRNKSGITYLSELTPPKRRDSASHLLIQK